ncbi:MAG: amidohydrolase family protein [Planctomycetaceae bacterium]
MTRRFLLTGLLAALSCGPALAAEEPYDILIRNGRIVDGTGNPWFNGDVAIRGGRIVVIHRRSRLSAKSAKHVIDAKGLVVAPGFIDIHSHSDYRLLEDGRAQSKIRQGVTTEILGEGSSAGPFQQQLPARSVKVAGKIVRLRTLGDYFRTVEKAGISVNVASYVGIGNVWRCVMGDSFARPSESDFQRMETLVDEAMKDGALGLSSQLMMPPGSLAKTADIIRLCKVVKRYGGLYSTHIRNEGLGVIDSVKEAIAIGEKAGVPVDVIHLKIADQKLWGRMPQVVALIEAARKRGVNVQANVYPYTRGNNNLVSIIPPWAHEGGRRKLIERLKDPELRPRLKRDINNGVKGWYNHYTAVGKDWGRMLVSADNAYRGLTMDRVMKSRTAGKTNPDLLDELFQILIENNGSVGTVYAHHTGKDMTFALKQPWCSVGSDGSAFAVKGPLRRGNPHPRNFGTFPRVLGVYVRELKLLRLEDAVRKMTSLNANKVGLKRRGLLKPGFFADVTIFNPATVIDRATYTAPFQYPVGIEYVIVNGQLVLAKGKQTGAKPGRALRRGVDRTSSRQRSQSP